MKTYMANPDKIERKWYVVDATGYTLGRLASEVAKVLRGKNKPQSTPPLIAYNKHFARFALAPKNCISLPVLVADTQQQIA